jgi:hypothetical protein
MYEKDGEKYFVVDSHSHFWDASEENWVPGAEQYAKGWIDCFYGYHKLGPPETHWDWTSSGTSSTRATWTWRSSSRRT